MNDTWRTVRGCLKRGIPPPFLPHLRRARQTLTSLWFPERAYAERVDREIATFSGDVSGLPAIAHYWSNKFLVPMLQPFGFTNANEMFRTYILERCQEFPERTCHVLSVGCGPADCEINIAQWLLERGVERFRFTCLDLNPGVLKQAAEKARTAGVANQFEFAQFDVNSWRPAQKYSVVLAIQFLHHVVELEKLFGSIRDALEPGGFFLTDDMIGRNGHMRWPEALVHIRELWSQLPASYKFNHGLRRQEDTFLDWDCSVEGFEGVRAQDVLPLLVERFHFDFFFAFGNIIDPFIDRSFGPNFDPDRPWDREFIDRVHSLDIAELEAGRVKPTHVLAAMTVEGPGRARYFNHFTPEFCVRHPNKNPK